VAKGIDFLALQIKDIARQHNIIIYEDKKLARALYKSVDVGSGIPVEFFEAVAEVLKFVYRANNA
jgi:flagellar biosynthetic protein FlhB